MTDKIKYSAKTDKAWDTLYSRLEQDGLLPAVSSDSPLTENRGLIPPTPCLPSRKLSVSVRTWLYAAAILILIGISVPYLLQRNNTLNEDKILTLHNEKGAAALVTTLEDGSVIYLGENASLSYPEHFSPEKRQVELHGNALFDVSGNKSQPFLITANQMEIEVVGTSFHVKNGDRNTFELGVKVGKVKVTNKENNHSILVSAGETVVHDSQNGFIISGLENENEFSHYTHQFRFKDEKLIHAVQVLNKQSDGKTIHLDSSVKNRSLTVTFSNNTIDEMAELISIGLTLHLEEKNNMLILSD